MLKGNAKRQAAGAMTVVEPIETVNEDKPVSKGNAKTVAMEVAGWKPSDRLQGMRTARPVRNALKHRMVALCA